MTSINDNKKVLYIDDLFSPIVYRKDIIKKHA